MISSVYSPVYSYIHGDLALAAEHQSHLVADGGNCMLGMTVTQSRTNLPAGFYLQIQLPVKQLAEQTIKPIH